MELANQYEATVAELEALARQLRIRKPAKLLQAARERVPGASLRLAQLVLEGSASKVFAPAYSCWFQKIYFLRTTSFENAKS